MQNKLTKLFDANIILSNPSLDAMIKDTLSRYETKRVELTEEETEWLAAGTSLSSYEDPTRRQKKPWEIK